MKTLCLSLLFALTTGTAHVSAQSPAATPLPVAEPEPAAGAVCPDCKMDMAKCGDEHVTPVSAKDQAAKQAETEKAVIELEVKWCEAEARHDAAFLEKVEAEQPDLVVLDVIMPYMDGFEVLRTLRKNQSTQELPVIMLTAKAQDADVLWGWHSGVDCYLTKPFNPMELLSLVKRILNGDSPTDGSPPDTR